MKKVTNDIDYLARLKPKNAKSDKQEINAKLEGSGTADVERMLALLIPVVLKPHTIEVSLWNVSVTVTVDSQTVPPV